MYENFKKYNLQNRLETFVNKETDLIFDILDNCKCEEKIKNVSIINSLNRYQHNHSVYPFGEFVHYTDNRLDFNPKELVQYLESENLVDITVSITKPTIEDTFMELAK